jgi:hypothetical protein
MLLLNTINVIMSVILTFVYPVTLKAMLVRIACNVLYSLLTRFAKFQ